MNSVDSCWADGQVHLSSTCDGNSVTPLNIGEQSYYRADTQSHILTFPAYTGDILEGNCLCFLKTGGGYQCSDDFDVFSWLSFIQYDYASDESCSLTA